MGDWSRVYHWFDCPDATAAREVYSKLRKSERHRWLDPTRWAVRVGFVNPKLVQAVCTQKHGGVDLSCYATEGTKHVKSFVAGAGQMQRYPEPDGFDLAWNYLVALKPAKFDLEPLASCMDGRVTKWGGYRAFFGATTPYGKDYVHWDLADFPTGGGPTERAIEALLLGNMESLQGSRAKLLFGMYSEQHGPVHTGRLALHVEQGGTAGFAILEVTGDWNDLTEDTRAGPYACYLDTQDKPIRLPPEHCCASAWDGSPRP